MVHYSPERFREIIMSLHNSGSPLTKLEEATRINPLTALTAFMSPDKLMKEVISSMGSFAPTFLKQGGVILGKDFKFKVNANGVGLATPDGGVNTVATFRLFLWLLFRMCSNQNKPCHIKHGGKYFDWKNLSPDNLEMIGLEATGQMRDIVVNNLKLQTRPLTEDQAKAIHAVFDELAKEEKLSKEEKLNIFFNEMACILPKPKFWVSSGGDVYTYDLSGFKNVRVIDLFGISSCRLNHHIVRSAMLILSSILGVNKGAEGQPNYLQVYPYNDDGSFNIVFDRVTRYTVTPDGVLREGQPVQCMLIGDQYRKDDYQLFDSFGSFLFTIFATLPLLSTIGVGTWERRYLQTLLPVDMEALVGAETHGMRLYYNKYVAHQYEYVCGKNQAVSAQPEYLDPELGVLLGGIYVKVGDLNRAKNPSVADKILDKYNLFFSEKSGVYMDFRLLGIKIVDLPQEERERVVRDRLKQVSGKIHLKDAIASIYELDGLTDEMAEEALVVIVEELVTLATTKKQKLVARRQLGTPTASNFLVDGELSAFVEEKVILDKIKRDVVHAEEACISETITDTAGLCTRWHPMKSFFVQKNIRDILEKYDADKIEESIMVGGKAERDEHPDGTVRLNFTSKGSWVQTNSWGRTIEYTHYAGYDDQKFDLIPLKGEQVKRGAVIFRIPYTLEGSDETFYHEVKAPCDIFIFAFEYFINGMGGLEYKFYGLYLGVAYKMRGIIKAMPAFSVTGDKYFYNSLNTHIPKGVKMLITQDCIKYKDLRMSCLPFAAMTAAKNGFGYMLEELNATIGFDKAYLAENYPEFEQSGDYLVYSDFAADEGVYNKLLKWFVLRYGQPVWVYRRDIKDGAWTILDEAMDNRYKGKKENYWIKRNLSELESLGIVPVGKFPPNSTCYTSNAVGDESISQYDDVFVFYEDDHEHCPLACWQRGWSFTAITNEFGETEHVWGQYKVEISDFVANCTTTKTMQSVLNNIAVENGSTPSHPELAKALMGNYIEGVDRYAAMLAMVNNQQLYRGDNLIPVISLLVNDKLNPEITQMIEKNEWIKTNLETKSLTVRDIAKLFKDVVVKIEDLKLYLPVLAEQDSNGSSTETASGLMRSLISDALYGGEAKDIKGRVNRLRALLGSVVGINTYEDDTGMDEGLNIQRAMTQGVVGMLAKRINVTGLPHKTVVPYSEDPGSYYQQIRSLFLAQDYTDEDIERTTLWETKPTDPRVRVMRTPLSDNNERAFCSLKPGDYIFVFKDEGVKQDAFYLVTNFIDPNCYNDIIAELEVLANIDSNLSVILDEYKELQIESEGVGENDDVVTSNSVDITEDRGDCDGDGEANLPVPKRFANDTPNMNGKTCRLSISRSTSLGIADEYQTGYTMDQMLPIKIDIKRYTNPSILSKKNLALMKSKFAIEKGELLVLIDGHGIRVIVVASGETKLYDVGWAYALYVFTHFYIGICTCIAEMFGVEVAQIFEEVYEEDPDGVSRLCWDMVRAIDESFKATMLNPRLFKPIAEVYEAGPLSGLNWWSRIFMHYLKEAMKPKGSKITVPKKRSFNADKPKQNEMDFAEYHHAICEAGINGNYSFDYYWCALAYSGIQNYYSGLALKGGIEAISAEAKHLSLANFARTAALLAFWATKGQVSFTSGGRKGITKLYLCIAYYLCESIDKEVLASINVPIRFLNYAVPQILRTAIYPSQGLKEYVFTHVLKEKMDVVTIDVNSFQ